MSEEGSLKESLSTELDTIKAVYLNDMNIEDSDTSNGCMNISDGGDFVDVKNLFACTFSVNLLPSTADAKTEQFVALTLRFQIPVKYPEEVPKIELRSPRGLSEEKIEKIDSDLKKLAEDKKGSNMLYQLIDHVKESLTAFNFPSGKCMICLYEFAKEDVFVKTDCFHPFHCRCLADYVKAFKERRDKEIAERKLASVGMEAKEPEMDLSKMPCPVCRLEADLESLLSSPHNNYPAAALSNEPLPEETEILKEARQQQEKFTELFEKQQSQGGIIDEEEKNKFLLRISDSPQSSKSAESSSGDSSQRSVQCDTSSKSELVEASGDIESVRSASNEDVVSKSSEVLNETINSIADNDKLSPKCIHVTPKSIDQSHSDSQSIDLSLLSSKLETLKTDDVEKLSSPDHTSHVGFENDSENPSKNDIQDNGSAVQEKSSNADGQDQKDLSDAPKQSRSGGRRRRRSRTKSGQASGKNESEQTTSEPGQQRNRSRPRRGNYRRQYNQYRPGRNRGRRRGRGRGGGGGNGYTNGGMQSPPFRHNLADGYNGSYGPEYNEGRHRQNSYSGDYDNRPLSGNRDRPGYYAARVFKPAHGNSRSYANKSDDAPVSQSAQSETATSELPTSNNYQQNTGGNRNGNRRGGYSRNRTRSERYSDGDYYADNANGYGNYYGGGAVTSVPKGRQNSYGYYSYRTTYQRPHYEQVSYYPAYGYYDNYNRPSYGYNYGGYGGGGYGFGYGRGGNRGNYNPNRRRGYKQRNRSDTNQSQASLKNETDGSQNNNATVNPVTSSPRGDVSP